MLISILVTLLILLFLQPWDERVLSLYPPDIATTPDMPPHLRDKLINNNFLLSVRMENSSVNIPNENFTLRSLHCAILSLLWLGNLVKCQIDVRLGLVHT